MGKGRHRTAVLAFAAVLGFTAPMTLYAAGARYFDPASQPIRRGPSYVLHAYDRRGVEMRAVADAQLGATSCP